VTGTRSERQGWGEAVGAAVAVLLLSPLVVFAKAGAMPLWGLFAVAAGIAVMLALAGGRLHDAFLSDVLRRRQTVGRWIVVVAVVLVGVFVVLVGVAMALVWVASGGIRTIPF
jgi:hypothetical protein